ncbi:MAG: MATE family efflux transporter [Lachnospiraceae bacterium]|nr:MATE family efflux transporter [Lachnospiraceae bacterium]
MTHGEECFFQKGFIFVNAPQNKLGTMPIGKLLLVMSVPMMISMFVQALYNIVDSIFVAQLSEDALTAVTLAFPIQNLMAAIGVGTGVGLNALVSRSLGRGDKDKADKAANVQIFLCICYSLLFIIIGALFSRPFYEYQTDVSAIIEYGAEYMPLVTIFGAGIFFAQTFEKLLISTGKSTYSMICQITGAVVNIILDPVFIFGLGPFPAMGVKGAAAATIIGQVSAAVLAISFNLRKNRELRFDLRRIMPDKETVISIYSVGIPSMVIVGLNAFMSYGMNQIFLKFSTTATAVFGIWIKTQSFGLMPVFGMNNGALAIYSYNFGSGRHDRVRQSLSLALKVGICVTLAVTVLYELIPGPLFHLFNASDTMLGIGIPAMRICAASMPFAACTVIFTSCFQALGYSRYSLILNLCRQLFFQIPAAWLLAQTGVLGLVWLAPLIAEAVTACLAVLCNRKASKVLN